jgi:hypothetical protein
MSAELMVGAKGLFIVVVLVILATLILVSGWLLLQLAIVLTAGFWLPLCFLLFEFSIVFKKVIDL